jgi:hypothetical protein
VTLWSAFTIIIGIPVWIVVFLGSALSRDTDGGIFLSVSEGVSSGLKLYVDIWDNKDPFFFILMSAASSLDPRIPFFMDLLWIPLASLGTWFIARKVMSLDRAGFLSLIVTPILIVGPYYMSGWTNTPGTSLVLLSWGFFASKRFVLAGIILGLLAFIKITVFPIGVLGIGILLFHRLTRASALRCSIATLIALGFSILSLVLMGWFSGYLEALGRNREYSNTVIAYFGFDDSPGGHLAKLQSELESKDWLAFGLVLILCALGAAAAFSWKSTTEFRVVAVWAVIASVGTAATLALTYVWPHHVQAVSLPLILAAIVCGAIVPTNWWHVAFLAAVILATFILSGWGSWVAFRDHVVSIFDQFEQRVVEIHQTPLDSHLLNSVPSNVFSYARLGTNDDRGFLGSVRPGATLKCPYFHLYDFSPPESFRDTLSCIQEVDVILKTSNFDAFARGYNATNVQPIIDYIDATFRCLEFEDRQLCSRL